MSAKSPSIGDVKKRLSQTILQQQRNLAYVQGGLDILERLGNELREDPKLNVAARLTELVARGLESEEQLNNTIKLLQVSETAAQRVTPKDKFKKPEGPALILPAHYRR